MRKIYLSLFRSLKAMKRHIHVQSSGARRFGCACVLGVRTSGSRCLCRKLRKTLDERKFESRRMQGKDNTQSTDNRPHPFSLHASPLRPYSSVSIYLPLPHLYLHLSPCLSIPSIYLSIYLARSIYQEWEGFLCLFADLGHHHYNMNEGSSLYSLSLLSRTPRHLCEHLPPVPPYIRRMIIWEDSREKEEEQKLPGQLVRLLLVERKEGRKTRKRRQRGEQEEDETNQTKREREQKELKEGRKVCHCLLIWAVWNRPPKRDAQREEEEREQDNSLS